MAAAPPYDPEARPLESAVNKFGRARWHRIELAAALNELLEKNLIEAVEEQTFEGGEKVLMIRPYWSDIVPLIFGDVLHNLRSALDQAFCELVLRNNGEIQKNTLFPISRGGAVDLRAMLTGQVANGSSPAPEIIATINDVVQPFRGGNGDLIVDLHELNIADKHMQPLFALSTVSIDRIRMLNGAIVEGFHFTSGNWRSYGSVRASFDDNPGLSWRVSAVLPEGRPQAGQSILEVADRLIQVVDKALFDLIDAESKRVGSNAAI